MIDDSEWIDEASREVVDRLGVARAEAGILLVCIARDDAPSDDDALLVGPLAPEEVEAALRQATEGAPLRPHELAALTARADGNPLFLTELWRAATHGEDSRRARPTRSRRWSPRSSTGSNRRCEPSSGTPAILGRGFDRAELRELTATTSPRRRHLDRARRVRRPRSRRPRPIPSRADARRRLREAAVPPPP